MRSSTSTGSLQGAPDFATGAVSDILLIRRISVFMDLTEDEKRFLSELCSIRRTFTSGEEIFVEGEQYSFGCVLQDGWAHRHKILADGRRQTFNFLIPGDLMGLQHVLLLASDQTIEAITDCEVCIFPAASLLGLGQDFPRLLIALMWLSSREISILQEHILNVGRRTALEALSHLAIELGDRLNEIQLIDDEYELPVTHEQLADALGLSAVHISRTLRTLRKRKILDIRDGKVFLTNPVRVGEAAEYTADFLDHERDPSEDSLV